MWFPAKKKIKLRAAYSLEHIVKQLIYFLFCEICTLCSQLFELFINFDKLYSYEYKLFQVACNQFHYMLYQAWAALVFAHQYISIKPCQYAPLSFAHMLHSLPQFSHNANTKLKQRTACWKFKRTLSMPTCISKYSPARPPPSAAPLRHAQNRS